MKFSPDPNRPQDFLRVCPKYAETPLAQHKIGDFSELWIKDETDRMGLGAFKAIGGIYAVARLIQDRWCEIKGETLTPQRLMDSDLYDVASEMTFICASAGNHGMAVAVGAKLFGAKARIYLSQSVPRSFENRLLATGADVVRSGENYDESVAAALKDAHNTKALLLADGSWEGYTYPPSLVMEGYTVIAEEMRLAFETNEQWPSHVFVQAGVGGLAAAITYMIRNTWAVQPDIIVVEPAAAPCLKKSSKAGKLVTVTGPQSNMGRLDCKVASLICFEVLEQSDVSYLTVTDEQATSAAAALSNAGFKTTPSGAAGYAGLIAWFSEHGQSEAIRPLLLLTERAEG